MSITMFESLLRLKSPPPTAALTSHASHPRVDKYAEKHSSRRVFFLTATVLALEIAPGTKPQDAQAGFEKFNKRRKLDPLETYVPVVILSEMQLQQLEAKLKAAKLEIEDIRTTLRVGPLSALRSNIRALEEYAQQSGNGQAASDAGKSCLKSLEGLDSLLREASFDIKSINTDAMKEQLGAALNALGRLLQTVPAPILEASREEAAAFAEADTATGGTLDPELKNLEKLIP